MRPKRPTDVIDAVVVNVIGNAILPGNLADIPPWVSAGRSNGSTSNPGVDRNPANQLASNARTFPLRVSGVRRDQQRFRNHHLRTRPGAEKGEFRLGGVLN